MANPFGEKNIGPWEGQQVEYIPLDDLVLWTENPRDPLDGDYTNDDVIPSRNRRTQRQAMAVVQAVERDGRQIRFERTAHGMQNR